ncbi:hypothetical protein HBA55_29570 [Pseudomaricurvus alkylphenolicus]|uniref:hypothetical protein n=1 Tax=Pseudomaricurvus alkylphenolicus TaxID=1306991 RepID=UPI001420B6A1|nr:hypothetical protein [Pseudomaricurvus alkylphenolicus]NIB43788.1 hypothetical protein [Pseudomaricurvus alkylphenolicus]
MGHPTIPIVRIELDGFKQSLLHAFSEHQLRIDEYVQAAVDEACKPERLEALINKEAQDSIDSAIKEELNRFYRYGEGREAIKKAVAETLEQRG